MIEDFFSQSVHAAVNNWRKSVTVEQMINNLACPEDLGSKLLPMIESELSNFNCNIAEVKAFAWKNPILRLKAVFDPLELPDTPTDFRPVPVAESTVLAQITAIACLAAISSATVSYHSENEGDLFVNLVVFPPGRGKYTDKSASKMSGHTDGVSFPVRGHHDPINKRIAPSPDFVCLSSLRNPNQVPTIVIPLDQLMKHLSKEHINELQQPQYIIGSQLTFRDGMKETLGDELIVDDAKLLFSINGEWWIRFSHSSTQIAETNKKSAQEAMDKLKNACANCAVSVPLMPGDIALVNNRIALHGRSEVGNEYGEQTRWLLRTYGLDISDIKPDQWHNGSNFMLYP